MTMYNDQAQANPEEQDVQLADLRKKVERTMKVMEENKGAIARWFFKGLLAFNLLLASVVLWSVVVPYLVHLL